MTAVPSPPSGFAPTPGTQRDYRNALSCFATGVTVITVNTPDGPLGMTANSFASVSLDPPLVLWSPAKYSERYESFATATHFAIHVLRHSQKDLALHFAKRGDAFAHVTYTSNAAGVPIFADCLARFECATHAVHEAGDHAIVVGLVQNVLLNEGPPLIFAQRDYGTLAPDA